MKQSLLSFVGAGAAFLLAGSLVGCGQKNSLLNHSNSQLSAIELLSDPCKKELDSKGALVQSLFAPTEAEARRIYKLANSWITPSLRKREAEYRKKEYFAREHARIMEDLSKKWQSNLSHAERISLSQKISEVEKAKASSKRESEGFTLLALESVFGPTPKTPKGTSSEPAEFCRLVIHPELSSLYEVQLCTRQIEHVVVSRLDLYSKADRKKLLYKIIESVLTEDTALEYDGAFTPESFDVTATPEAVPFEVKDLYERHSIVAGQDAVAFEKANFREMIVDETGIYQILVTLKPWHSDSSFYELYFKKYTEAAVFLMSEACQLELEKIQSSLDEA